MKAEKINEGTTDNPFIPPSRASQAMRYAKEFVSDALVPLSRKLKNISPQINAIFRQHEGTINKTTREYLDRTAPFITSMTKRLKGNKKKKRV